MRIQSMIDYQQIIGNSENSSVGEQVVGMLEQLTAEYKQLIRERQQSLKELLNGWKTAKTSREAINKLESNYNQANQKVQIHLKKIARETAVLKEKVDKTLSSPVFLVKAG